MKKILVPIDYSEHSDNALKFAVELAKKMNAVIHICHALEAPALVAMPGFLMWPENDFEELQKEGDQQLADYVVKLKENPTLQQPYLPAITCSTVIGMVKQVIDQTIDEQKPDLVVMGMEGKGKLDRFLLGSISMQMIEKPKAPLLLIPKLAVYRPLTKIAFATDLSETDLHAIHQLARLFCLYNPEILLVHIDEKPDDFHDPRTPANQFLNRVTCSINYAKIYYRHITETDVDKGLQWLGEHGKADMLSMIHRHHNSFSRLLSGSHTKKLAVSTQLPLLLMPENQDPIGW